MVIGTVLGSIWATRKEDGLMGIKLLKVKLDNLGNTDFSTNSIIVAVDRIGAGTNDKVIISCGTPASNIQDHSVPIDALIIGIIDPE